jgi:uncharacterized protein with FMN-binding domain
MRARPIAAVAATVGGLALMFSFKTPSQQGKVNAAGGNGSTTTPPATTGGADTTATTAGPDTSPASTDGSGTSSSTAPPTTAAPTGATRTVKGQAFANRYGDVQVELVLQGTKIVDVKSLVLPNDRQRSAEISQQAGPWLHDEVLQAQSAQIDIIGGATYTSEGYMQSVQSALDAAAKA